MGQNEFDSEVVNQYRGEAEVSEGLKDSDPLPETTNVAYAIYTAFALGGIGLFFANHLATSQLESVYEVL